MPASEQTTRFSGDRLKALRQSVGFSRTQLAAAVGRSHWALESWERGEFEPNLRSVTALMQALGCSFEDLITKDDPAGTGPSKTASVRTTRHGHQG